MTDPWSAPHELRFGAPLPDGETTLRWWGPALMGVVNVTPDSFSDGGALSATAAAVEQGLRLRALGALVIDVGGESTRPGAAPVGAAEELKRIIPTIEGLADAGVLVSVDTRKPEVAERALAAGARIVNDIAGLRDPAMRQVCVAAGAPAVIMHMRGEPRTMQDEPRYEDVVSEVSAFLNEAAERALADGVPDVLIDPGLGFGKTLEHNLALLRATAEFAAGGHGVLIGASRKGFLGTLSHTPVARERLGATLAAHLAAADDGAAMLRVHDVEAHRQALLVATALASGREVSDREAQVREAQDGE